MPFFKSMLMLFQVVKSQRVILQFFILFYQFSQDKVTQKYKTIGVQPQEKDKYNTKQNTN